MRYYDFFIGLFVLVFETFALKQALHSCYFPSETIILF